MSQLISAFSQTIAISYNPPLLPLFSGLYGLQFLLAPAFVISQNFKVSPDKYHTFLGRFCGATMLLLLFSLKQMDTSTALRSASSSGWSRGCLLSTSASFT